MLLLPGLTLFASARASLKDWWTSSMLKMGSDEVLLQVMLNVLLAVTPLGVVIDSARAEEMLRARAKKVFVNMAVVQETGRRRR